MKNSDIRWNFEKFLVDHNGKPYKRYDPNASVKHMENDINYLLELRENSLREREKFENMDKK